MLFTFAKLFNQVSRRDGNARLGIGKSICQQMNASTTTNNFSLTNGIEEHRSFPSSKVRRN